VSPDTDTLSEGGLGNENSRTYYFGSSTITVGKIKEMVEKGYILEDETHALGAEIVPEPYDDEAVVYEDSFVVGLRMPPYLTWLIFYYTSKHNCISCRPMLSHNCQKKFLALGSFGGVPSGNVFAKWYVLHY
jgi:hypothetical protein